MNVNGTILATNEMSVPGHAHAYVSLYRTRRRHYAVHLAQCIVREDATHTTPYGQYYRKWFDVHPFKIEREAWKHYTEMCIAMHKAWEAQLREGLARP